MDRFPADCILVLFGATGDLTRRKLIPALYNLHRDGLLPKNFAICAYARKPKDDVLFREELQQELETLSGKAPDQDWNALAQKIFYVTGELGDDNGYARLKERLSTIDKELRTGGSRLYYLAVGSEYYIPIIDQLGKSKLLSRSKPNAPASPWVRVVLEKPIGHDLESAQKIAAKTNEHAREQQVFRIDHYLGKETVQNILAMRFGNCVFEPLWNRKYVDHVQISVAEMDGIGTRAGYYETAGALRDMVQNHLLQLLCLVAMEAPGSMSPDDIRNEKVKILRNLRKLPPEQINQNTVRGQYGPSADGKLPGYRGEPGVAAGSQAETFVALRCFVDTWRWADVPFLLRAGKRMPRRETEISIHFRVPPLRLFGETLAETPCDGNVLTINIQPDEGVNLLMQAKAPGSRMRLERVEMAFDYSRAFQKRRPDAYERLLLDAMSGDATLFTRADEVDAQWEFIHAIHEAWKKAPPPDFPNYFAGTWGPDDARRLLTTCAKSWHLESQVANG